MSKFRAITLSRFRATFNSIHSFSVCLVPSITGFAKSLVVLIVDPLEFSQLYQLVNSSKHPVVVRGQHFQRVVGGLLPVLWCSDHRHPALTQLELLTAHHSVEAFLLADLSHLVGLAGESQDNCCLCGISDDRVEKDS